MRLWNELKTFLAPSASAAAPLPEIGAPAPMELRGMSRGPAIIAFLRHCGCPFAEATVRGMREAAQANSDIKFLLIGHASPERMTEWLKTIGGPGDAMLIHDESMHLYRAWGLGYSNLSHFLGSRSLKSVLRLRKDGIINRNPGGFRRQKAGTFALNREGNIAWRHVPEHAGDLPDLQDAVSTVK